jgi:hypothetical protein
MKAIQSAKVAALAAMFFVFSPSGAKAQDSDIIVTTAEGVGSFNSSLSGTSVETFNNLAPGVYNNVSWNGVGTIDQVSVLSANQYGGAPYGSGSSSSPYSGASPYAVQSASSSLGGVQNTTLHLNSPSSYFGLYWSAGDAANQISFYNGQTLVGSFSTQSLMDKLPSSYYGNPNTYGSFGGKDSQEPFGFINFLGGSGTSWDTIVLSDTASSGFESDNWTSRVDGWNPAGDGSLPGTPVVNLQSIDGVQTTSQIIGANVVDGQLAITQVDANGFASTVNFTPNAPAPPLSACLAFAGVLILQSFRKRLTA